MFEAQLRRLTEAGYRNGSLLETTARTAGTGKTVVLTFDDGCTSVSENALGPLARHGFTAVQFIVAGLVGGFNEWDIRKGDIPDPLMTQSQIREWLAAGHTIGSHSCTHQNLRHLSDRDLAREVGDSKRSLEDTFQVPIQCFAYPFGSWNPRVRDAVRAAGYQIACTMDFGVNPIGTDPLALRRMFPLSGPRLLAKAIHRAKWKITGNH